MRLLMLNGNTNTALTDWMARRARQFLGADITVSTHTAASGVAYIASRRDCAIAAGALMTTLAQCDPRAQDAVLLACFGEPGLAAAREVLPVPVVGMLEASVLSALQLGARFSIITPGVRWPRMIEEALDQLGASRRCLGITALTVDDLTLPTQRDRARERLQAALDAQLASLAPDVVVVGGAALAGLAAEVTVPPGIRLIDSLEAALAQAQALARLVAH